jgi:coenzyme F420-reducing hydrogenase delta subunit
MINMSSAEAQKFADAASEMTERCKRLGPNPVKKAKGPGL